MGQELLLKGIILQATPVGDYDKRLVVLTKELGRITIFAKGARKMNSPYISSEPFFYCEFQVYAGKTAYTLSHMTIKKYFSEIRTDLIKVYYGIYFAELISYFTRENNDEADMLKLLYVTLNALTNKNIDNELIKLIFELKSLTIQGLAPQIFECVNCKAELSNNSSHQFNSYTFIPELNGIVCNNCLESMKKNKAKLETHPMQTYHMTKINESSLYTLQYIITAPYEKLYSFTVSNEVLNYLKKCIRSYMQLHIDVKFNSLEMIHLIK